MPRAARPPCPCRARCAAGPAPASARRRCSCRPDLGRPHRGNAPRKAGPPLPRNGAVDGTVCLPLAPPAPAPARQSSPRRLGRLPPLAPGESVVPTGCGLLRRRMRCLRAPVLRPSPAPGGELVLPARQDLADPRHVVGRAAGWPAGPGAPPAGLLPAAGAGQFCPRRPTAACQAEAAGATARPAPPRHQINSERPRAPPSWQRSASCATRTPATSSRYS